MYRRGGLGRHRAEARIRLLTDTVFRIPAVRLAEAARRPRPCSCTCSPGASPPAGRTLGAFHGLDLPFTWNRVDFVAGPLAELAGRPRRRAGRGDARGVGRIRHHRGPAAPPPAATGPAYDPARRATMLLDDASRVVDDPLGEERRLWDGVRY